jgi:hypothetical protein
MHDQWRRKMRRLCQDLDEAVVWPDSNESNTPLPLSRSKSFSLRLTSLIGNQIITDDDHSTEGLDSGIKLHKLFSLLPSLLDDDDLTEHKISELCEIFFGYCSSLSSPPSFWLACRIEKTVPDSEFVLENLSPPGGGFPIQTFLSSSTEAHFSLLVNLILSPRVAFPLLIRVLITTR